MPKLLCALSLAAVLFSASHATSDPFEFRENERVVLVGDTLIEREQTFGALEERLSIQFPAKKITFRNLGWSADTPAGISRASFDFDKPGRGFEILKQQISAENPSLVIVGYGMAASFDGDAGLDRFRKELTAFVEFVVSAGTNQPV